MILSSSSKTINEEEIKVVSNGTGDNLEFVINEVFALILSHSLHISLIFFLLYSQPKFSFHLLSRISVSYVRSLYPLGS